MTQQTPYQPPVVNPRPRSRSRGSSIPVITLIVTPLMCLVIGTAAGALSRSFRNDMSGVHYEAIIELGVKVLVNVAVLIACFLIPKNWIRLLNYAVATSLLWASSTIAWTVMNGGMFRQHLAVNAISLFVALIVGMVILLVVALARYALQANRNVGQGRQQ